MKRIIKALIVFIGICICSPVFAKSSIDYKLTIDNDYKFSEEIKYTITDYESVQDGVNDALLVLEYDVPVFMNKDENYHKEMRFENNTYYVTLTYKYDEENIKDARFINSCFYNDSFVNDSGKLSFTGSGNYICNMFDELTITVKSGIKFTSNNADEVKDDEYIWRPKNNKFNIELKYDKITNEKDKKEDNTLAYIIIFAIIGVLAVFSLITYIRYKRNS